MAAPPDYRRATGARMEAAQVRMKARMKPPRSVDAPHPARAAGEDPLRRFALPPEDSLVAEYSCVRPVSPRRSLSKVAGGTVVLARGRR